MFILPHSWVVKNVQLFDHRKVRLHGTQCNVEVWWLFLQYNRFHFPDKNPFKDSQPLFTLSNEEIEAIPVDIIGENESVRFPHVFVVESRNEKIIFQLLNYSIIKLKSNYY